MHKSLLAFVLAMCIGSASAQTGFWSNAGSLVSVRDTSFISVQGDMYNSNGGIYYNYDSVFLTGDWSNTAGNHAFDSTLVPAGTGYVYMYGADQRIKGSDQTYFHNLVLKNQGTKFADLDAKVDGFLDMTDREFNVDTNTIWVRNPRLSAVRRTTGFLSSLGDGGLLRYTDADSTYLYPVGSTAGTTRYRPIEVTPTSALSDQFKVRFANVDPATEGYDRSDRYHLVCSINPNWYHRIYHPQGIDSAALSFYYDPNTDGMWTDIVHWQDVPEWESIHEDATAAGLPFARISRSHWGDYSYSPFALAVTSPPYAHAEAADSICSGASVILGPDEKGADYIYHWTPTTGLSDSTVANPVFTATDLTNTNDLYHFTVEVDYMGCTDTASTTVTVFARIRALAGIDTILWDKDSIHLVSYGGVGYSWTPDYNIISANTSTPVVYPEHSTVYYVLITDTNNCTGSDSVYVLVREKPFSNIFIPDVITPNGDGYNDFWHISDLERYPDNEVRIINRWGDELLYQKPYQQDWKGQWKGENLPGATYYYVIKIRNDQGQEASFNGPITVVR